MYVNEREEGVVALLGLKKSALGWSRYRDANSPPTSPLADDVAIVPVRPVSESLADCGAKQDSLKICSGLEPVPRCELSNYQPIWLMT